MAEQLLIPKFGNTVEEVTIIEWMVPDGSEVKAGQEVLEIETDKAVFAVEATADGILHHGPFSSGDVAPILTVVALIGDANDTWDSQQVDSAVVALADEPETIAAEVAEQDETPASAPAPTAPAAPDRIFASPRARALAANKEIDLSLLTPTGPGGRILERDVQAFLEQRPGVTPVARKLAEEAKLDVYAITGTGPSGRITKRDVERTLAEATAPPAPALAPPPAPAPTPVALPDAEVLERVPLKGVRGIIAERMGDSVHTTARVTLVTEADATEFVAMRQRLKASVAEEWGFAPGYNDLLALIVAKALRKHPYMNARLAPDAIEYLAHVNLGMAVDTERGLLVPNIKDADAKSLRQFGSEFRELAGKARSGRVQPDALTGGTFTITSLGPFDIDAFTPVINLPEAAILGVGRIAPKPAVVDGEVVARQMWTLSLVFDHRIIDGAPAARFLQYIKRVIEEPYLLLAI
ncbi:MAG TPA: 2-oxo acid dehydrogenase subunit E2 [Caldilineae bacterium]|nr:2-oxo acid dehydrogenase subunit E2 [Caldilineae bacterium]